jgi:hypothetical protein
MAVQGQGNAMNDSLEAHENDCTNDNIIDSTIL